MCQCPHDVPNHNTILGSGSPCGSGMIEGMASTDEMNKQSPGDVLERPVVTDYIICGLE